MKVKKITEDVYQVTFKHNGIEKTDVFSESGLEQALATWKGDSEMLKLLHDIKNAIIKHKKPKKEVQNDGGETN